MNRVSLRLGVLLLLLAVVLGLALLRRNRAGPASSPRNANDARQRAIVEEFLKLEAREDAFLRQQWGAEVDARKAEDQMFQLWDALNRESDFLSVLERLPIERFKVPSAFTNQTLDAGIQLLNSTSAGVEEWSRSEWQAWLALMRDAGWKLHHSHWQLPEHRPAASGQPASSRIDLTASLSSGKMREELQLTVHLLVHWTSNNQGDLLPASVQIESAHFAHSSGGLFSRWLDEEIPVPRHTVFVDPLVAADLDHDGATELILVGAGRVWRSRSRTDGESRSWKSESLGILPPERIWAAVFADVNGDRRAEWILAGSGGITVQGTTVAGLLDGTVSSTWTAPQPLKHPQVLAAGDVDGDGDLDLWLVQYKLPYQGGQFPTPWFDANDGFPSYLLLNDGRGHFTDATAGSGLAAKRLRRTYSASFIDLDGDGDQDLVNVSDFAGVDLFLNDGTGKFADVTATLADSRHAFGMAHAFQDVNADGRPDLLMLGMDSPMASRLNSLGLERGLDESRWRSVMAHGNRLLLSSAAGLQPATGSAAEALRLTGWSWGCSWADFNNDGRPDLAVANGHETFASTRDYDRQFWTHDLHVAGSTNHPVAEMFFRNAGGRRRAEQGSYGGWQENQLLLSGAASVPINVAWLLGVALPADCRNLVADDFDGDGRLDLAVTTFEQWPVSRQRLVIFRNELPPSGRHWLGVELPGDGRSLGARVEVETSGQRHTQWLVTGDSFRTQRAARLHFGLGEDLPVRVIVTWPGGRKTTVEKPGTDAWLRPLDGSPK